ncbi:MAG: hypothetical protein OIF35_08430, partial [Cellvibrionaceae bacterium]|nr:hypothetical protein [Cellvibrionaceae bacterium]
MKVKTRVSVFALALALIPLLSVTVILGWFSFNSAQQALNQQLENSLVSRREAKRIELEDYFDTVNKQLLSQAQSTMLVDAVQELDQAFKQESFGSIDGSLANLPAQGQQSVRNYYENDYSNRYK